MNRLIGITGGMSSGKTILSKKILKLNKDFIYIDIDIFRRGLYQNKEYINEIKEQIKELKKYKKIDSLILNKYIYSNEEYMSKYKKILYKYLFKEISKYKNKNKTILIDWALILNDNLEKYFDKIIYLDIDKEIRLARLKNSDLSKEDILKRFKLQEINLENYKNNKILIIKDVINMNEINNFINSMECKFTLPNNESKAIWEITHSCNYGCSYCIFSCNKELIKGELTTNECFHVIDELEKCGFKHLKITGGEPFLRKDIIEILKYSSNKMVVDISTNASLITPKVVEELNKINLKMIHVSLDGNKYEHEKVRGKNTYESTIRGLEYLKKSKNKIRIGCVIHSNNENNLEEIINISKNYADEIIFSIMEPVSNQDKSQIKKRDNQELLKELDILKDKYQDNIIVNYNFKAQPNFIKRCPAGDKFLYINNFGNISPCPWVYENNRGCISNKSLKNSTLEELLNEPQLEKFTKDKKDGICYGKI